MVVVFLTAMVGISAMAEDRRRERAESQLERITVFWEMLQSDPQRSIPPAILREARAVVILRETRAGFILGGKGGFGAMLVRGKRGWSAPAPMSAQEGGIGLQAGWQSATFVQVLMSEAAVEAVRTNRFRFGVGLRVTSGPRSMGDEAKTSSVGSDVLLYADTGGVFGGLAVEGGSLRPDRRANRDLYGVEAEEVLFGSGVVPTEAGRGLIRALTEAAKEPGAGEGGRERGGG